uniref:Uncharacterized protein n=1 Tax=Brassica oleracea var. oleracea TaxID=109376 RepID=A0A0D3B9C3_BRAOL
MNVIFLLQNLMFDDEETNGLTCFEPEHPSSHDLFSRDFEEESFDYSHQGPLLGTRRPMDDDLCPIFDEEDEPGPTFEVEAPSVTSIIMEKQLCFDPGTTLTPLSTNIQEHCEKLDFINSLPEMFVKISSEDVKRFGFDKVKEFRVSNSIFENMVNSFQVFKPDKLSDQKRFQIDNDINSNIVLSFDQFLKHSKGFDDLEKLLELGLQQPVFCARQSRDSFVFKENGFDLRKETLISYLSKYMSCTYNPRILVSVFSVQDKHVQSQRNVKNKSIDRAYQPEIWRFMYSRKMVSKHQESKMDLRSNPFQAGGNDAPQIIDLGQDDATMGEPNDSSIKNKPGWINGEHTDLKPAAKVDELDELTVLSDTTLELYELSDTTLELSELSDTEDGAGLAAGRNEPCSA